MDLEPGKALLHYRIVEKLGEGGMGVVWKALDTTLDRTVAIKVLPESFGQDSDRLARFEREAKSLAALNHPNVASLFGLHVTEGSRFISMEFVEGEDLSQRIARGALPPDEAVRIAIGIAEGIATAHANGIVHRDLKPANVMLDADGTPKVLDFGLAKTAIQPDSGSSGGDPGASPTITSLGTVAGTLLGTAAYMSPEQARGKPVDKRADTWALGCILLEMLTGRSTFAGETISDTLASVLKTEPAWDALPENTPRSLKRVLRRSLAKNPRDRWQDAGDLRYELERTLEDRGKSSGDSSVVDTRRRLPMVLALLAVGIALGAVLRHVFIPTGPPTQDLVRGKTVSEISTAPGLVLGVARVDLALSPDGSWLTYVAIDGHGVRQLYVRSMSNGATKRLPDTTGAEQPFWSPDGEQIGFHTETAIKRTGLNDGTSRPIVDIYGLAGVWGEDGRIYFCSPNAGPIQTVVVETGITGTIPHTQIDKGGCNSLSLLPYGKHILFEATEYSGGTFGIFLADLDSDKVAKLYSLKTNVVYSAGHLVFHDGPRLMAQRIDTETVQLVGDSFVVANPVFETNFPFHGLFSAARDRPRVVYLEGTGESLQTELVWFDRQGEVVERTGIIGDLYNPQLSRDARRVLLDVSTYETEGDVWLFDLARESSRRLTSHPVDESAPVWSQDESTVYFYRVPDLYKIDLKGDGEPVLIHSSENSKFTEHSSIDGMIVFTESGENFADIKYYDPETGEVSIWLASPHVENDPRFSPDGKWLAYQSDESGQPEIYVDTFPQRGERFQVTHDGGSNPSWSADGKELYYMSLTHALVAVPVDLESDQRPIGVPSVLFRPRVRRDMFVPHPSGKRFLVVERLDPEIDRAILVDDWD